MAAIALQIQARRPPAALPSARPGGGAPGGALAVTLRALAHWWSVGRHYRPERRYMRGGSGVGGVATARTAAR
jgi:hypothetical protein